MSKRIEQKGYIVWRKYHHEEEPSYVFYDFKPRDTHETCVVMPYVLTFDLPDRFDPTGQRIASLEAMKDEAQQKFQETVAKINLEISKLQALTYEQA